MIFIVFGFNKKLMYTKITIPIFGFIFLETKYLILGILSVFYLF